MKHFAAQALASHTLPLPQEVPFVRGDHAVVEVTGLQSSHAFAGFCALAA